jgi:hypothetical protein
MTKKAEFSGRGFIITLVLVIGVMMTFGTAAVNLTRNYASMSGVTIDDSKYNQSYYHLTAVEQQSKEIDEQIQGANLGSEDSQTTFYGDIMSALKMVTSTYGAAQGMIFGFASDLKISPIWQAVFMTIFVVMIAFAVIYTIFNKPA